MSWPTEGYLEECRIRLARATCTRYAEVLRDAQRRLEGKPLEAVTRRDLLELAAAWKHRDQNLSALRGFLVWTHSPLAHEVPHGIRPEQKRQLIWYQLAEVEAIVAACSTARERLVVHLALELMMRRVELERLRWEDLEPTQIRVLGKGRHGGKVRRIPYHPYTRELLEAFRREQEETPRSSRWTPPGTILNLRRAALNAELAEIEQSLRWEGVRLSLEFHALRRTGGRLFVQAGISIGKAPLEVLNELRGIYGHEDLRTTLHYIGWELEEAGATMAAMPELAPRRADVVEVVRT